MTAVAGIELPEGDPGAVESAASSLDKVAADFASSGKTVQRAINSVSSWRGVASISFSTHCGTHGEAGRAGSNACQKAATALRRYGRDLSDARERVRTLQRKGEECVQRIGAAELRAAGAAIREAAANVRAAFGDEGARGDADAARGERQQAEADAAAARADLRKLQEEAEKEREKVKQAAKATAGTVRSATGLLPTIIYPQGAPTPRLKVPDPGESPLDRLFGRDYVYPEEAANTVLEMGVGGIVKVLARAIGRAKPGAPRTRLVPGGGLAAHEGAKKGHTLLKHIGLSDDALRLRLKLEPHLKAASSFTSRAVAEDAVSGALLNNAMRLRLWLSSSKPRLEITQEFDQIIGRTIARDGTVESVKKVFVLLVRDNSKLGYHIRTSFPTP